MANAPQAHIQDVAWIADRILNAHRSAQPASLEQELARARQLLPAIRPRNTFEKERLEVLQGALDSIGSLVTEQAWAAIYLLEQLAGPDAEPIRRKSLPA